MPVAGLLTDVTTWVTNLIGDYGLYAVFVLMLIDAVFPAASEVVMVYAGAVATGAFAGQSITLFGYEFESGFPAYVAVATAGTVGYLIGAIGGWALGDYLGRPWLEHHGRWLHLSGEKLDRAERWFDRWEEWAVFLGTGDAGHALVHLRAGGRLPGPIPPVRLADAARLGGVVLRVRGDRLGCGRELGEVPPRVPLRRLRRRRGGGLRGRPPSCGTSSGGDG